MTKLRTTIEISTGGLDDYSVPVEIEYRYIAGCSATYTKPGEADTVQIEAITVIEANGDRYGADWLIGILEDDAELLGMIGLDWNERREYALEQRADAIREERMLGQ